MSKALKAYEGIIRQHGLTLIRGSKHWKVVDTKGVTLASVSGSGEANALRQSIRDLVRLGCVPAQAKRIKF